MVARILYFYRGIVVCTIMARIQYLINRTDAQYISRMCQFKRVRQRLEYILDIHDALLLCNHKTHLFKMMLKYHLQYTHPNCGFFGTFLHEQEEFTGPKFFFASCPFDGRHSEYSIQQWSTPQQQEEIKFQSGLQLYLKEFDPAADLIKVLNKCKNNR